jgi:hypothetical protein
MPDETVDLLAGVDALEQRVDRLEAMTEVVTAIRGRCGDDRRGCRPRLAEHVAELADAVENHGLLLARLLEHE